MFELGWYYIFLKYNVNCKLFYFFFLLEWIFILSGMILRFYFLFFLTSASWTRLFLLSILIAINTLSFLITVIFIAFVLLPVSTKKKFKTHPNKLFGVTLHWYWFIFVVFMSMIGWDEHLLKLFCAKHADNRYLICQIIFVARTQSRSYVRVFHTNYVLMYFSSMPERLQILKYGTKISVFFFSKICNGSLTY